MPTSTEAPLTVVVLDDYQDVARSSANWSVLGPALDLRVLTRHIPDEDELVAQLQGAEVIVAMRERTPLSRALLERLPDLRLVVTTGSRNAAIDPPPGLLFCGTRALTSPTVELTWALILTAQRRLHVELPAVRDGGWQSTVGEGLEGSTIGIIGLGNIGARVAAIATVFGMNVLAWSANLSPEAAAERSATRVDLPELLEQADIVSIHSRLSDRTRGLIGERELGLIGPKSLLVNTSRAEIVNQPALFDALTRGTLGGAALDVFDHEPLPPGHPLLVAPRTVLSPHIGYVVRQNYELFYGDAVEDIAAYRSNTPVREISR